MGEVRENGNALLWTQYEGGEFESDWWSAADATHFYRVSEFTDPSGLYGHERGWRLVLASIERDKRQVYYGETREMCMIAAQAIHDGVFFGMLYGPTTIDQIDPSRSQRVCWTYEDGKIVEHFIMTSASPIGDRETISLGIEDLEVLRDVLEAGDEPASPFAPALLSKIEQMITRHYAGLGMPVPKAAGHADLWSEDDDEHKEKGGDG